MEIKHDYELCHSRKNDENHENKSRYLITLFVQFGKIGPVDLDVTLRV